MRFRFEIYCPYCKMTLKALPENLVEKLITHHEHCGQRALEVHVLHRDIRKGKK